jgi:hypothetical protein
MMHGCGPAEAFRPSHVLGHDAGAARATNDHRLGQPIGRRRHTTVRRRHHLPRHELHFHGCGSPAHNPALDFDEVAGAHRLEKLDLLVGAKEALVAVGQDAQLGGDIAEQLQHLGPVDERAGIVGIVAADAQPEGDLGNVNAAHGNACITVPPISRSRFPCLQWIVGRRTFWIFADSQI